MEQGCYWSAPHAERVVNFFEKVLRHTKGRKWAGKPFILLPWEREIIEDVYGWLRPDGTRRIRVVYIEVAKKKGKSTFAAGTELYMLVGDGEPAAEVYSAATARKQAAICWKHAAAMVRASPMLKRRLNIIDSTHHIVDEKTGSICTALSKEAGIQEGLDISACVLDELHVHKSRTLYDTLLYGGAARSQPLCWQITTAGVYDVETIGWEQHSYAEQVLSDKIVDPEFYARIYAVPMDADWKDDSLWHLANPSMGHTIDIEEMRGAFRSVERVPAKQNAFRRYRLNQWTQQTARLIDMDSWLECPTDVTIEEFKGQSNFGGGDLAATEDLAAFVLQYKNEEGQVRQVSRFWLPEARALQSSKSPRRDLYARWADGGYLTLTPGKTIDDGFILAEILAIYEAVGIEDIGLDKWNAVQLAKDLESAGLKVEYIRQGILSMSPGTKHLVKLIIDHEFAHDGNPVLTWCMDNVSAYEDSSENIKPVKEGREKKIDGVVATVMALSRLIVSDNTSAYRDRGVLHG